MTSRAVSIARGLLAAGGGRGTDAGIAGAARGHVGVGPLEEALLCLVLAGDAGWLDDEPRTRARVDLMIWEAGAGAIAVPELGAWLTTDPGAMSRFVLRRATGALRERALAARMLAVCADGFPSAVGDTTVIDAAVIEAAARLASHPEAVVWIPAVRGLGRLAGRSPAARLRLSRWYDGTRPSERRRALAALASAPAGDGLDDDALRAAASGRDPWFAASLGVAAPHLARERPALWAEIADRILERPGAQAAWSVSQGLTALCRHGDADDATRAVLARAREQALAARARSTTEAQLWLEVRDATDFLDGLDPDPAFPAGNLERAVRDAVRAGASRTVTRATAVARSITATFDAMLRTAGTASSADERGHALSAVESCTRAVALGLWRPLLAAAGRDPDELDDELGSARAHLGAVLAGYLEVDELGFTMRRAALRGLGHLVDAEPPAGRSRAAAFALSALARSKWARGRGESSGRQRFRKPVTDLLWRLGDALDDRGDGALGRVAAWWALTSTSVELLELVHPESNSTRARIDAAVRMIRDAAASAAGGASAVSWGGDVLAAIDDLGAGATALAAATEQVLAAVDDAETAARSNDDDEISYGLDRLAETLSRAAELARDPAAALAAAPEGGPPGAIDGELLDTLRRAIEDGTPDPDRVGEVWASRVGALLAPAIRPLVATMVRARRQRFEAANADRTIGPYRTLHQLGGGGHGEVWLVVRDDGRRRFVLKRPRRSGALSTEARSKLSTLIEREARLLEGLHEGKVASFIDHGWDGDTPYLVLEYLVGVDLFRYASVRLCEAVELAPVVRDMCIGLRALHSRGIVHRDLKPSNVFLRLSLPPEADEEFRHEHRDPAVAPVSDAVLIDFGVSRLMRDVTDEGGHPEGTLGYLSPEQAESSERLTGKSDVYALTATLFHVMTGRRFFQDRPNATAQLVAHAFERPLRDRRIAEAAAALPPALVDLFDQATSLDPDERPDVDEFARRYALVIADANSTL